MPIPRQALPPLDVALVGGGRWSLAGQHPDRFSLVVFYRGHHCAICRGHLRFVISSDGTLDAAVLNTMPFGRPHLDEIVGAIRYVSDHNYPARGEA